MKNEDSISPFKNDNYSYFRDGFQEFNHHQLESSTHVELYNLENPNIQFRKTQNLNPFNISSSLNFAKNNFQDLKKKIKILKLDNIVLIKGDFAKTVPTFFKKNFNVFAANIDSDLYKSYKIVLKSLSSRLSRGGVCSFG
jgi:tRNA G46 methylase TrmB